MTQGEEKKRRNKLVKFARYKQKKSNKRKHGPQIFEQLNVTLKQ